MAKAVAQFLVETLAQVGIQRVFGAVGDALNEFSDALRGHRGIGWLGVRHDEGAALAAAGQAKQTGRLEFCRGATGPAGNHLAAGLYEARKDRAWNVALDEKSRPTSQRPIHPSTGIGTAG